MLIRFQVGGDASPNSIAQYFTARCYVDTDTAGLPGDREWGNQFAPEAGARLSPPGRAGLLP